MSKYHVVHDPAVRLPLPARIRRSACDEPAVGLRHLFQSFSRSYVVAFDILTSLRLCSERPGCCNDGVFLW